MMEGHADFEPRIVLGVLLLGKYGDHLDQFDKGGRRIAYSVGEIIVNNSSRGTAECNGECPGGVISLHRHHCARECARRELFISAMESGRNNFGIGWAPGEVPKLGWLSARWVKIAAEHGVEILVGIAVPRDRKLFGVWDEDTPTLLALYPVGVACPRDMGNTCKWSRRREDSFKCCASNDSVIEVAHKAGENSKTFGSSFSRNKSSCNEPRAILVPPTSVAVSGHVIRRGQLAVIPARADLRELRERDLALFRRRVIEVPSERNVHSRSLVKRPARSNDWRRG